MLFFVNLIADQSDIYFANGIRTLRPDAELNTTVY